jgi:hypothetical protein
VGVDLFAYTRQELAQIEEAGHQFLQRVKRERVCLFRRLTKDKRPAEGSRE